MCAGSRQPRLEVDPVNPANNVDPTPLTALGRFQHEAITIDPATGEFVPGDVKAQTDRVMRNLAAILEAAGTSLDAVVRCTVYLADMDDFAAMNAALRDRVEATASINR